MYKCTNLTIGILTMITLLIFTISLYSSKEWVVAITYISFGFCCYPILILAYAFSSEITYPIRESTSSGFFIMFAQIFGLILTYFVVWIKDLIGGKGGVFICIIALCACNIIGIIFALLVKPIGRKKSRSELDVVSGSFLRKMIEQSNSEYKQLTTK